MASRRVITKQIRRLSRAVGCALAAASVGCSDGAATSSDAAQSADGANDAAPTDQLAVEAAGSETGQGDTFASDAVYECTTVLDCPASKSACTQVFCMADHRCKVVTQPVGASCNDNNACTTQDKCDGAGACIGPTLQCSDENVCTDDYCDPATGCKYANNIKDCKTEIGVCGAGHCEAGKCKAAIGPACDDGNPCTLDTCNKNNGCSYKALSKIACDDNNVCTSDDACAFGACVGVGKKCADDNPCTDDTCDLVGGCAYVNNTKSCNDSNICTSADACSAGVCGGITKTCDDGDACTTDACDPVNGLCVSKGAPDGTACGKEQACSAGVCK